jgi:hypothetical protein
MEQVCEAYISLRDKKKEIEERQREELKPIRDLMYKLEMFALQHLQDEGGQNLKTPKGTVYLSTVTTPTIEDWDAFKEFLMLDPDHSWGFLTKKPNKEAVENYLEAHGDIPPGIKVKRETFARIRR